MNPKVPKGRGLSKGPWIAFGVGAMLAGVLWGAWRHFQLDNDVLLGGHGPPATVTPLETIARVDTTVFFPRRDLLGLVPLVMSLRDERGNLKEWIATVLSALSVTPSAEAIAVFPGDLRPRRIFLDEEATLYIDLPRSATDSITAGVELEGLAIEALTRSIGKNVPGVKRVKLMVEGSDRETLWGHIYLRKPFSVPSDQ